MFSTIFKYEMSYWIKNPIPYFFAIVLFAISWLTMWGMSAEANIGDQVTMMNSYYRINSMASLFSLLLIFLLPAIMGNALFRDYTSGMYTVLYTYPFTKAQYLSAKFLSAFTVVCTILLALTFGFIIGTVMPGVKPAALLDFDIWNYTQLLVVFLIPNMLFAGSVVFAVIVFTRNIYISFIAMILLIMFQFFGKGVLVSNGFESLAAVLDPLGESAVKDMVKYWTLAERNHNTLPIKGLLAWNRIVWLLVSLMILSVTYLSFRFNQSAKYFFSRKSTDSEDIVATEKFDSINFPKINLNFSRLSQFRTAWSLSNIEFRTIVMSWSFLTILLAGLMLVLFQQHQMNPQNGVVLRPITANMLRVPMFFFSGVINLLTFLYAGVLMYKAKMSRMDGLMDTAPQPNWVMMLSKFLAIVKMQWLLLFLVMLGGITAQLLSGYYRFEIPHYLFELFLLNTIHFIIWACLAICVHSVARNMYMAYFVLILIPTGLVFLPSVADYLGLEIFKETIFYYNNVKDQLLGFEYSDFNGYGSQLITYFMYKSYWLIAGIGLLLIGLLWWKRGLYFSFAERWHIVKSRFRGQLKFSLILGCLLFISAGFNIYYQENHVSKVYFSSLDEELFMVKNEERYLDYVDLAQPVLSAVNIEMDIYPGQLSYQLEGVMTFVNKQDVRIDTLVIAKSLKDETNSTVMADHEIFYTDDELGYVFIHLDQSLLKGDSVSLAIRIQNYPNDFLHNNSKVVSNGTYLQPNIMPSLGIRNVFLRNKKKRKEYGLAPGTNDYPSRVDSNDLGYSYINRDIGLIDFECVLSTSSDQTALSIGNLQDRWHEGGRNFYHFKSNGPIKNTMTWLSGIYEKSVDESDFQYLEMYRHPQHDHNDNHMFNGLRASLNYCSRVFGPLGHDTLKVVEFPITKGTYATLNGNLIPFSESYFHCDVHSEGNDVFNMPFYVAAHEVAHYWWGHRVDPANIPGGRFITEGMADYLALKAIEHEYGVEMALSFRKKYHDIYLKERARQANETPLIESSLNNEYLNYRKAALSIYAMSQYVGEDKLHAGLAQFEQDYRFAEAPFPTAENFVDYIRSVTPDTLQYLIGDMFERICLYDNTIENAELNQRGSGYDLNVDMKISKYYSDRNGKRSYGDGDLQYEGIQSAPLQDYITIRVLGLDGQLLLKKKVLVQEINNTLQFYLTEKPSRIVIDPDYLLIDANREDDIWLFN